MSSKTNACRKLDSLHIKYTLHEYEWDEEHLEVDTARSAVPIWLPLSKGSLPISRISAG